MGNRGFFGFSRPPGVSVIATGGAEYDSGGYHYHVFTVNGVFVLNLDFTLDIQVIAGGGGGSSRYGGGGGAGGYLYYPNTLITAQVAAVTIGAGGTGTTSGTDAAKDLNGAGSNTTVFSYVAIGGGRGYGTTAGATINGGSGGGVYTGSVGTGTAGQGNNGGLSGYNYSSGGGGGAGGVGGNAPNANAGGAAGAGVTNPFSYSGSLATLAAGGAGSSYGTATNPGSGSTANSGNGGNAGGGDTYGGVAGAAGLVVIRYAKL